MFTVSSMQGQEWAGSDALVRSRRPRQRGRNSGCQGRRTWRRDQSRVRKHDPSSMIVSWKVYLKPQQVHTATRCVSLRFAVNGSVSAVGGQWQPRPCRRPERAWLHTAPPGVATGTLADCQPLAGKQRVAQHSFKREHYQSKSCRYQQERWLTLLQYIFMQIQSWPNLLCCATDQLWYSTRKQY